ncbi:MAG: dienelactone hydrolase family protein, partial [Gammaproteobacteria bacterium]
MGSNIELVAADGHSLSAYRADPEGDVPRGGIVVIQEVFGVNRHIRSVCEGFATAGYAVVAPALFDRLERGVELDYDEASLARGRELRTALGWERPVMDVA